MSVARQKFFFMYIKSSEKNSTDWFIFNQNKMPLKWINWHSMLLHFSFFLIWVCVHTLSFSFSFSHSIGSMRFRSNEWLICLQRIRFDEMEICIFPGKIKYNKIKPKMNDGRIQLIKYEQSLDIKYTIFNIK